jgi:hypothetical protein
MPTSGIPRTVCPRLRKPHGEDVMTRSKSILVGVGTLGTVAFIGIAYHWMTSERPGTVALRNGQDRTASRDGAFRDRASRDGADSAALVAAQLAELTAEVSSLRGRVAAREAQVEAPERSSTPEEIEDVEEESRLKWQEHMAEVEAQFKRERVEPSWARETSQLIERELAAEPGLRAAVRSMECRAQSCRLELNEPGAPGAQGSEHALPLLIHRLGTALPVSQSELVDAGNGQSVRVVYLLKGSES